ncbi:hypothetical protein HDU85_002785 [Gaertneriomyces sp. JEL0708]|nr:hypothetical protein HDU85_002785 [Gaertneriomyces sp. JEL0708]
MESFCHYYGYPISISARWCVQEAVSLYAQYDGIVFGDKAASPSHEVYNLTVEIVQTLRNLKPAIKIFGYIPIGLNASWKESNLTLDEIGSRIREWKVVGATHLFLDEFGYDYLVSRERQNAVIDMCRKEGMGVCVNSWKPDWVFSSRNITLDWLNGFQGNPQGLPCLLGAEDYVCFESVSYTFDSNHPPNQKVNDQSRLQDLLDYTRVPRSEYKGESYFEHFGTRGYALDAILKRDESMFMNGWTNAMECGMSAYCASVGWWGANGGWNHYTSPRPASQLPVCETLQGSFACGNLGTLREALPRSSSKNGGGSVTLQYMAQVPALFG